MRWDDNAPGSDTLEPIICTYNDASVETSYDVVLEEGTLDFGDIKGQMNAYDQCWTGLKTSTEERISGTDGLYNHNVAKIARNRPESEQLKFDANNVNSFILNFQDYLNAESSITA